MIFRQLFDPESCTFSYLLGDEACGAAVIVDPVREQAPRDLALLGSLSLRLAAIVETHVHADHITGAQALKRATGAQTAVSRHCGASGFDMLFDHEHEIRFGDETLRAIATPGHTPGSTCLLWRDRLLTGDTLLIDGCGRTDFQSGDAGLLFDSVTTRLFTLPDDTLVYPGHDYKGRTVSTIGEEKRRNARFANVTRAEFVELMSKLDLPHPKRMAEAVPANLQGGVD